MSIEAGRAYFRQFGMEDRVQEFTVSSATVDLAAKALGVEGARIAKTLSFKTADKAPKMRMARFYSPSRGRMLSKLMTSVEALCSSAEVAGGRTPATPRQISRKLKLMILR